MKFTFTPPSKPIEPGIHRGQVVSAEEGIASSGADQITVEIRFDGGFKIKDRLTASEKAMWRVTQAFVAFGFKGKDGEKKTLDPDELVGRDVTVRLDKGKPRDDGRQYLEIVEYVDPEAVPI